jgi:hypothetical protein
MPTIRQELQAKLDLLTATYQAEKAPIEAELAKVDSWLDKEWEAFKGEMELLIAKVRGSAAPTVVNPPVPPVA